MNNKDKNTQKKISANSSCFLYIYIYRKSSPKKYNRIK